MTRLPVLLFAALTALAVLACDEADTATNPTPGPTAAASAGSGRAVTAAEALALAQDAIEEAGGYHVEMAGHNLVLPQWGGIDGASLDVGTGPPRAAGTLQRTGDGPYHVSHADGGTYFRRDTCDHLARVPGGGATVLDPFLWAKTGALREAGSPAFAGEQPAGAIAVEADLPDLGRVRIELDPETYLPERLAQPRDPAGGTESTWTFSDWGRAPDVDPPDGDLPDRGPGGNPC